MSVCHVDDLVEGLLAAAGRPHPSGEVYQVGDPIPRTFEDIGRAAARVLGVRVRRLVLPLPAVGAAAVISEAVVSVTRKTAVATWDKFREYRQKSWVTDVSKARTELGISAVWDLAAGVASTIAWYRAEGWL
jgi:nucleoside-diphosphate-sugar epimerase